MTRRQINIATIIIIIVVTLFVYEMSFRDLFSSHKAKNKEEHLKHQPKGKDYSNKDRVINNSVSKERSGLVSGVYYSNWSPYEPRLHFPHDIDVSKISHVYYSFFVVDPKIGSLKSSDTWSDFEMTIKNPDTVSYFPKGCVGELFDMKLRKGFKVIMAVGGWSNRESFPKVVKDKKKFENLVDSCVTTMFKYGFDGIDLDWEFPEDDKKEPQLYFEMAKQIRLKMNALEEKIYGDFKNRFHLSVATPAFDEKLKILQIQKMDQYITYWNMMTYDYYGEWSEKTGYHSNLYNGNKFSAQYKHQDDIESDEGLNGDSAIKFLTEKYGISSTKIILGIAAYGRGFTNVKAQIKDTAYIGKSFKGVGGESEGEPGMWLYNQLPIENSKEQYDPNFVSAYCFDPKSKTFVGYDNIDSVKTKAKYVMDKRLGGAFWWESCGDDHKNPKRSLINAYINQIGEKSLVKGSNPLYKDPKLIKYYLEKYPKDGFLTSYLKKLV